MTVLPTVGSNPWFVCAALFALKIALPGWLWCRALAPEEEADGAPAEGFPATLVGAARIVLAGLSVLLAVTLALAMLDLYRPGPEAVALALTCALAVAVRRRPVAVAVRGAAFAALALFAGVTVVMNLPRRGEWVAGGWDPGLYVCEGVSLSRTGRLFPAADPFYASLSPEELKAFTRPTLNFTEAFPVAPLDPARRAFTPFFFRLTPALVAALDRCGGLRAATRVNDFAGLLVLLLFPAFLLRCGAGRAWTGFATALLVSHPLWLYHLHFPTSEMLQLALVCGLGLLLPDRLRPGPRGALAALMLLATVNRFSFLPFGALVAAAAAWLDLSETDRRRVAASRAAMLGALALGALFDLGANRLVLGRLGGSIPLLLLAACGIAAVAVALDLLALRADRRVALSRMLDIPAFPLAAVALAGACVLLALLQSGPFESPHAAVRGAPQFLGPAAITAAALGVALLIANPWRLPPVLRAWLCVAFGATLLTFAQPGITPWWPWAARRFVEFSLPAMVLLAAAPMAAIWDAAGRRRAVRIVAVVLFAAVAAAPGSRIGAACRTTEFDGLTHHLAAAAARIEPGDIVIADHFRWGTPLRFLYGVQAVNGELFWDRHGGAERWTNALPVLRRAQQQGRRVRIFTGTDEGLTLFPGVPADLKPDWTSGPWTYSEVLQHPRARTYKPIEKTREFRLYTLPPLTATR